MTKDTQSGYKNPRACAFEVLYKIEYEKAYLNIALKDELSYANLKEADRRLVSALVYGCIRYKMRLDYIISQFSSVKLKKISDKTLIILRLGIYQMLFMDKIPESAAVNESVKLCAKFAYKSKGFANGILRSVAREKGTIKYPNASVYYSYPEELCEFFNREFENGEEIMEQLNRERGITIRANLNKITAEELACQLEKRGIKAKRCEIKNALVIGGADITNLDLYKDGYFTVQGLSSIVAVDAMGIDKGDRVLDMCAAPGGKSIYIAEKTGESGRVLSFDIHPHKAELILKNAERMGLSNVSAKVGDASEYNEDLKEFADKVLCDVPCAGLGIISKKPDIKYSYTKEGHAELKELQLAILKNASKYVKKGGSLLYSTCSVGNYENLDNVNEFLKGSDFKLESIEKYIPDELACESAKAGYINIIPKGNFDGFFICKMRRNV